VLGGVFEGVAEGKPLLRAQALGGPALRLIQLGAPAGKGLQIDAVVAAEKTAGKGGGEGG